MKTRNVDSIVNEIYTCLPNDKNKSYKDNFKNRNYNSFNSNPGFIKVNKYNNPLKGNYRAQDLFAKKYNSDNNY